MVHGDSRWSWPQRSPAAGFVAEPSVRQGELQGCQGVKDIKIVRYQDLVAEDRRIDRAYFTSEEIHQISNPSGTTTDTQSTRRRSSLRPTPSRKLQRMIFPDAYEGVKELLDQEGWHELPNHDWLHVASDTGNITVPPADHPAGILPWRSTWIQSGRSGWTLHEDEVRWQDLRDQQRRLPVQEKLATLYQAKIDPVAEKRMRQFPGMRQITLGETGSSYSRRSRTS